MKYEAMLVGVLGTVAGSPTKTARSVEDEEKKKDLKMESGVLQGSLGNLIYGAENDDHKSKQATPIWEFSVW